MICIHTNKEIDAAKLYRLKNPRTFQDLFLQFYSANQKSQLPLSLWIKHTCPLYTLSPVDSHFAEKKIQFLVIRLLNYKNEVQFFTSDNSNGTVCQRLRVKLHYHNYFQMYIKRTIYLRWQQIFTIFDPCPPPSAFFTTMSANLANFLTPSP